MPVCLYDHVVRMIAIAWMVAGLGLAPGCMTPYGTIWFPPVGLSGGNDPERICAPASTGQARNACLAVYRSDDESADNKAAELKRERENAQIVETGMRLRREHEAAQARKPTSCVAAIQTDATPADLTSSDGIVAVRGPAQYERLDPAMISEAVAKVKTQVMSCRDQSPVRGQVLVSVKVAAVGCVIDVTIKSTPDPALGTCVATAIQNATFAKTQSGGSFRYPFVF